MDNENMNIPTGTGNETTRFSGEYVYKGSDYTAPSQSEPTYYSEPIDTPPVTPSYINDPGTPEKSAPSGKKKKIIIIAAIVIILAAIAIPVSINLYHKSQFEKATAMMNDKDYAGAYEIFDSLGDYETSKDHALFCHKGMDYQQAGVLMLAEDYAGAKELLDGIPGFEDADSLSAECQQHIDYNTAKELFNKEDFSSALTLLRGLDRSMFPDVSDMIYTCESEPKYRTAIENAKNGKKYDAYTAFTALGDYKDSKKRAEKCVVKKPGTGTVYRNDKYSGSGVKLTIVPPKDGTSTFFKIYNKSGKTLVASIFINKNSSASIKLPAGSYIFKAAYSTGKWFGKEEMFGDDGTYQVLTASPTSDIFTLKNNYIYTLSLRSGSGEGSSVGNRWEDPGAF